jgi:hypothetical protein
MELEHAYDHYPVPVTEASFSYNVGQSVISTKDVKNVIYKSVKLVDNVSPYPMRVYVTEEIERKGVVKYLLESYEQS